MRTSQSYNKALAGLDPKTIQRQITLLEHAEKKAAAETEKLIRVKDIAAAERKAKHMLDDARRAADKADAIIAQAKLDAEDMKTRAGKLMESLEARDKKLSAEVSEFEKATRSLQRKMSEIGAIKKKAILENEIATAARTLFKSKLENLNRILAEANGLV